MKASFLFNPKDKFIPDYNELVKKVEALRTLGQRIVVTIGTWDMFHPGHARYLLKAKGQGDILVVGVDSDQAVKRYKGPHRPINPQGERVEMLTYQGFVDLVTMIEDVDDHGQWYCGLITMLRPDIFVAVEDSYPEEQKMLIQRYCGQLVVLPRQAENISSTEIIRRAINANPELMKEFHRGEDHG